MSQHRAPHPGAANGAAAHAMPPDAQGERPAVVYLPEAATPAHERVVHAALAQRLALLMGFDFAGEHDPREPAARPLYVVPAATLDDPDLVRRLGVCCESDLFGGAVPHPFVATKIITHDLVDGDAAAIRGWSPAFARRVAPVVLHGFSAFAREDAWRAGRLLLRDGPVRIKPACARGGRGQAVARDEAALRRALDALEEADFTCAGVVLEEDLADVVTFSVGQIRLPALTASYSGTQRLAPDNRGQLVYGGSDLDMVRGGFESLMAQSLPDDVHRAVAYAWRYDQAASECFDGLLASRRNYDVVIGRNARGEHRCGVLEQSWRIGGASGAEVAGLEVLAQGLAHAVSASVVEQYGRDAAVPPGATLLYRDDDGAVGWVTKFAVVSDMYGNPK